MARAKKETKKKVDNFGENIEIAGAGLLVDQPITETLRTNYMPYAMSVIISRAIPEIDGFKPSHRKLLYTMYTMGLLTGQRTKSANVVGQTMKLNPHGDAAIYETMVRMTRANEALLHPYVDSKGNFGKAYSRDMAYAASRYTEVKLASFSELLFNDIKKDTVDFVDNYDGTMKEPSLFPVAFPSILVNSNLGIAVGMASSICPFNLAEVCETTVNVMRDPDFDIKSTLKGPDFAGGGYYVFDENSFNDVINTGRGSFRIRSKYTIDEKNHRIEITEIPPSTTVEAIIDKITELVKGGKIRELSDVRDETDKNGLTLALELKRGVDEEKFMQKLFKLTPLEDNFSCNFTVLINGAPRCCGIRELLTEWIDWRRGCVTRRIKFELKQKNDRLHILQGLSKILLDIDEAIKIIRNTKEESEVIPNLMIGFGIDEIQAEYIAEIKLRHLNKEYILNRLNEMEGLMAEIDELKAILGSRAKLDRVIMKELAETAKKFAQPRRTKLLYEVEEYAEEEEKVPDYPINIFFTAGGYFKKISPQSLRMSSEQKLKEGDRVVISTLTKNDVHLLFFTDRCNVYKARPDMFSDTKASVMGDYVPGVLGFEDGEVCIGMCIIEDYKENVIFVYENGKAARVKADVYETKTNRKRLQNAYGNKSPLIYVTAVKEDTEFAIFTDSGRMLLINSALIPEKAGKSNSGVTVLSLKKGAKVSDVKPASELKITNPHKFRSRTIPTTGGIIRLGDIEENDSSAE